MWSWRESEGRDKEQKGRRKKRMKINRSGDWRESEGRDKEQKEGGAEGGGKWEGKRTIVGLDWCS